AVVAVRTLPVFGGWQALDDRSSLFAVAAGTAGGCLPATWPVIRGMYWCAVSFIAFGSHVSASMALVVVIGEVTSVRVMVGPAYGEGDERTTGILRAKRISGQ